MFNDLFSKIPAEYIPQISDCVAVILPCIATYLVTRYSLNRPRRIEIMQKQFDLVYLPLYKLTHQLKPLSHPDKSEILNYVKHSSDILQKNYELVFPHLHTLFNMLSIRLSVNSDYANTLEDIVYQIEFDYERLKRQLGYPSENIFQFYKRMKTKDKFRIVLVFLLIASLLLISIGLLFALKENNLSLFLFAFIGFIFICISLCRT